MRTWGMRDSVVALPYYDDLEFRAVKRGTRRGCAVAARSLSNVMHVGW